MTVFIGDKIYDSSERSGNGVVRLTNSFPPSVIENNDIFREFMESYIEFLNQKDMPVYDTLSLNRNKDLDRADAEFIDKIIEDIANDMPIETRVDRNIFYKKIVDFYNMKGSLNSVRVFFRVFFDSEVEVTYPKDKIWKLSDGNWDADYRVPDYDGNTFQGYTLGLHTNDKGSLSESMVLSDGYYYQPYSYVIKTSQNLSSWQHLFNKLVHPAGLIFFGEVDIYTIILQGVENDFYMPDRQPAYVRPEEFATDIITFVNDLGLSFGNSQLYITVEVDTNVNLRPELDRGENHHRMYHDHVDITQYVDKPIDTLLGDYPYSSGVYIGTDTFTDDVETGDIFAFEIPFIG